jgi:hypothetical protein
LVTREFPIAVKRRNVVATMFNYDSYLPARLDRDFARKSFGFAPHDFVILIFGALRKPGEIRLIKRAYRRAKVPYKRLLMAGRFVGGPGGVRRRWNSMLWLWWLKAKRAVAVPEFIPGAEVHRFCEAADVIVVPRLNDLSSGLVGLGATFSRLLIAPKHGSFPDYLAGTDNLLYESGNADSLAKALQAATQVDRDAAGRKNRALADGWTWERILQAALSADEAVVAENASHAG